MLQYLGGDCTEVKMGKVNRLRRCVVAALVLAALPAAAQGQDSARSETMSLDSLLNTPVNTAAKYNQTIREVAGSVTIITAEDIRRFGYITLEDVLQGAVGFYQTYDRQYTYTGVRGFGRPTDHNNRILLLLDGHTINQGMDGSNQVGASMVLNLASLKRIEIVRGPSSALYGTGAMFAVINLISNEGGDAGAQAEVSAGSAGFRRISMTAGTSSHGYRAFTVSALWDETSGNDLFFPEYDAPSSNNGVAQDLDWERRTGINTSVRMGAVSLRARYGSRSKGIPTGAYGRLFNDSRAQSTDEAVSAEVEYTDDLSDIHHLSVRSYLDLFTQDAVAPSTGPTVRSRGENRAIGGEAAFHWDLASTNRLTTGIEYRSNEVASFVVLRDTAEISRVERPFAVTSFYAQNVFQARSNVALIAGVRYEMNSLTGSATAPRFAVIFDPWAGTTFKAMYGEAFRAPSAFEVGFKSFGSPELGSERLAMLELIAIQRLGARYVLTGSAYSYRVRDLIEAAPTTGSPFVYGNRKTVEARGLELSLNGHPSSTTRLYLNYSFQRAVDVGGSADGEWLTNSPEHLLKAGFGVDLTRAVSASTEIRGESRRLTLAGASTDPFMIANLNVAISPFRGGLLGDTEVRVQLLNVFDTGYAYPGSIELRQDEISQDGRSVVLRIVSQF